MEASKRIQAQPTLLINDDVVRVTRFDFDPGAETGWHVHEHDYVIVAITECRMLLEEPDSGYRDVIIPAGAAYKRAAGVRHNVVNNGERPMSFVETELL
jgi:quercetin dioxygenase-like cupin family protein